METLDLVIYGLIALVAVLLKILALLNSRDGSAKTKQRPKTTG
ncbi:MAG: hypothetical protein UT48_C0007G0026 [Parcubacteria group bacterium GW2011_GWE2_39_37]|nr:MAG: hypothetical protein UT48_C0007G0026 [Parcubacteria group bacterium GW2011_GWE2_39_37]